MRNSIGFNYIGDASHDFGELHINWNWLIIINDWPASGLFVIGFIIVIGMIIHGIGLIFFGYGIKAHSS